MGVWGLGFELSLARHDGFRVSGLGCLWHATMVIVLIESEREREVFRDEHHDLNPRPKHRDEKAIHKAQKRCCRQVDSLHANRALDLDGPLRVWRLEGPGTEVGWARGPG
jgi:hypothetical protein